MTNRHRESRHSAVTRDALEANPRGVQAPKDWDFRYLFQSSPGSVGQRRPTTPTPSASASSRSEDAECSRRRAFPNPCEAASVSDESPLEPTAGGPPCPRPDSDWDLSFLFRSDLGDPQRPAELGARGVRSACADSERSKDSAASAVRAGRASGQLRQRELSPFNDDEAGCLSTLPPCQAVAGVNKQAKVRDNSVSNDGHMARTPRGR